MRLSNLVDWMWTPPDSAPRSTILIRCMVGGVFLWEGILKFVYTNQGVGRFTKIGIPAPELMAHFVAVLEIVGGVLLIAGFLTRIIAIPFVIEMVVAILSTKVALYFGTSPLPLPPSPPQTGAWAVLHEIRSDYAQIMSVIFLLVAGPGPWSVDAILARVSKRRAAAGALSPNATVPRSRVSHDQAHDSRQGGQRQNIPVSTARASSESDLVLSSVAVFTVGVEKVAPQLAVSRTARSARIHKARHTFREN